MTYFLDEDRIAILQSYLSAGDRSGYYGKLQEWGDPYGALAQAVADQSTLSGRIANAFLVEKAVEAGVYVTDETLTAVGLSLMQTDFNLRSQHWDRFLTNQEIEAYHSNTFQDNGIPIAAWTAYAPLKAYEENYGSSVFIPPFASSEAAREAIWSWMLGDNFAQLSANTVLIDLLDDYSPDWSLDLASILATKADYVVLGIGSALPPSGILAGTAIEETILQALLAEDIAFLPFEAGSSDAFGSIPSDLKVSIVARYKQHDLVLHVEKQGSLLRGFEGGDQLFGSSDTDHLEGGNGNDVLRGGAGGFDLFDGGDGDDTADLSEYVGGGAGSLPTRTRRSWRLSTQMTSSGQG